jgi:hypothetical protein
VHKLLSHALEGLLHPLVLVGSAIADGLADIVAARAQVPLGMVAARAKGKVLIGEVARHLVGASIAHTRLLLEAGLLRERKDRCLAPAPLLSVVALGHLLVQVRGRWTCSRCSRWRSSDRPQSWRKHCSQACVPIRLPLIQEDPDSLLQFMGTDRATLAH